MSDSGGSGSPSGATKEELTRTIEELKGEVARLRRRGDTLDGSNRILRETIFCQTEHEVAEVCLEVALTLTSSAFGFVGLVNQSGRLDTIALSDPGWEACRIPESSATQLVNDMELRGLFGYPIRERTSVLTNDPSSHPESCGIPEGHPDLHCYLGVPLVRGKNAIGVICLANKEGGYDESDQKIIEDLSTSLEEALSRKKTEKLIARQSGEILEVSTPVMQVWTGVVLAPIVGTMNRERTERFRERLLEAIVDSRSEVALIDITGVSSIDSRTAQDLIETTTAVKLLGARVVLTGVSPLIARTLVALGVDTRALQTRPSLEGGLRVALNLRGIEVPMERPQGVRG